MKWTQDTFHVGEWEDSNVNNNLPFGSLQAALREGNAPEWLVPTRIPDGYELVDITVDQSPMQNKYLAKYANGEQSFIITVKDYLGRGPSYVEQHEGLIEEYEVAGITYYLFSDIDMAKAVWISGSYECYVFGNVTIEELKMMINSIVKG